MLRWLTNVFFIGQKEIKSLLRDSTLVFFVFYSFTFTVYSESTGVKTDVQNASLAIIDNDQSNLSRKIIDAFQPPYFKPAKIIIQSDALEAMNAGIYSFVLNIDSGFEKDILRNRTPGIQLNVDATGIAQAGIGVSYIQNIVFAEVQHYLQAEKIENKFPVSFNIRALYNPNLDNKRYQSAMSLVEQITIITLLLVGSAVIRESEHGTLEHLMAMPVQATEIAFAKILASCMFIISGATLCLFLTIKTVLQVPLIGSTSLFLATTFLYMFDIAALAILLTTLARTMPQFGLLATPVFLVLMLLSGAYSPLESMPYLLRNLLQISPTVHFVKITQGILFRAADIKLLWVHLLVLTLFGTASLSVALARFKQHLVTRS